jgi:hypothetical protein
LPHIRRRHPASRCRSGRAIDTQLLGGALEYNSAQT